jgi:hypothetical protein
MRFMSSTKVPKSGNPTAKSDPSGPQKIEVSPRGTELMLHQYEYSSTHTIIPTYDVELKDLLEATTDKELPDHIKALHERLRGLFLKQLMAAVAEENLEFLKELSKLETQIAQTSRPSEDIESNPKIQAEFRKIYEQHIAKGVLNLSFESKQALEREASPGQKFKLDSFMNARADVEMQLHGSFISFTQDNDFINDPYIKTKRSIAKFCNDLNIALRDQEAFFLKPNACFRSTREKGRIVYDSLRALTNLMAKTLRDKKTSPEEYYKLITLALVLIQPGSRKLIEVNEFIPKPIREQLAVTLADVQSALKVEKKLGQKDEKSVREQEQKPS